LFLCGQMIFPCKRAKQLNLSLRISADSPHSHEWKTKSYKLRKPKQRYVTWCSGCCAGSWWCWKSRHVRQNPGQPPTERRAMMRQILCLLINTRSEHTLFVPAASVITEKSITIAQPPQHLLFSQSLLRKITTRNDLLQLYWN